MKGGELIGLLKFFRDAEKLKALQDGTFYCSTPERYRLSNDEGVSDLHESCNHSYRFNRGDEPLKIVVGGHELEGLTAATIYNRGVKDKWLHCWFALRIPSDEDELELLTTSINRMRNEFGSQYAFLQGVQIKELATRLLQVTEHKVDYGSVRYSDDRFEWGVACKSLEYAYQNEYRFVIGECSPTFVEPLILVGESCFSDLISKSPTLQITDNKDGHIWFHLDSEKCFWKNHP